jgi:hypothetical protein
MNDVLPLKKDAFLEHPNIDLGDGGSYFYGGNNL